MTLAARIRRSSIALLGVAALVALAVPALAGNRATPGGGCEEPQAKPRSGSSSESAAAASRRENASIEPCEEGYVPLSRTAPPVIAPAAPRPVEASLAPSAPARIEKPVLRPRTSAPAATPSKAKKPAPPRAKVSIPNLPATPGMGTLLRVGVTAGREIS